MNAPLLPERLLPTLFILIAPPAVVGLSALQLGCAVAVLILGPIGGLVLAIVATMIDLVRRIAEVHGAAFGPAEPTPPYRHGYRLLWAAGSDPAKR